MDVLEKKKRFETKTNDECIGKIYQTTDYSKFKLDELNRPLNAQHANNLYNKLKSKPNFLLEPIAVSSDYTIIDGQHRFYALSKAHLPITYFVDNRIEIEDAPVLNSKAKNWTPLDYIRVYAKAGNNNYKALLKIYTDYSKELSIVVLSDLMSIGHDILHNGSSNMGKVKSGQYMFDFVHESFKRQFIEFLASLKPQVKIKPSHVVPRLLAASVERWYFNSETNKKRLRKSITYDWAHKLGNNINLNTYNLGILYNKGLRHHKIPCFLDTQGHVVFPNDKGEQE